MIFFVSVSWKDSTESIDFCYFAVRVTGLILFMIFACVSIFGNRESSDFLGITLVYFKITFSIASYPSSCFGLNKSLMTSSWLSRRLYSPGFALSTMLKNFFVFFWVIAL